MANQKGLILLVLIVSFFLSLTLCKENKKGKNNRSSKKSQKSPQIICIKKNALNKILKAARVPKKNSKKLNSKSKFGRKRRHHGGASTLALTKIDDGVINAYMELKARNLKYVILKPSSDNTKIVVDRTAAQSTYEDFVHSLPSNNARFAIFDFSYFRTPNGLSLESDGNEDAFSKRKVIFITWYPDTATLKERMACSTAKDILLSKLPQIDAKIFASKLSDISSQSILELLSYNQ